MRDTAHTPVKVVTATPTAARDALGVITALSPDAAQVKPREARGVKMLGQKRGFVEADRLSPEDAERFAGKLNFYNTAVFGYLGRAALRPLYFRAYARGCPRGAPLTWAVSAAFDSFEFNLNFAPPRIIPFACVTEGDHARTPTSSSRSAAR